MIEIKNMNLTLGKKQILKEINLTIDKPEIIALVGNNGAGKTTLINCILGTFNCKGSVKINGENPFNNTKAAKTMVIIDEKLGCDPLISVNKYIKKVAMFDKSFDEEKMFAIDEVF